MHLIVFYRSYFHVNVSSVLIPLSFVADPCADVSCKSTETCVLDERRQPVCRCADVCDDDGRHRALTATLAPVCGSDGRTYRNGCAMRRYVCRTQHEINAVYRGSCTSPSTGQPASSLFLPCDAVCTVSVIVILSVRPSVCHTRGLCPHGSTYDHDFFTTG